MWTWICIGIRMRTGKGINMGFALRWAWDVDRGGYGHGEWWIGMGDGLYMGME